MGRGDNPDVQALIVRLADGDRSAFHPAFEAVWPLLRRFTGRHLPPGEAEDAAQEAIVKIFRQAASFDPARSALAWMLAIAAFEIRTVRRRRMRRREEPVVDAALRAPDPGRDPEESALARDLEAVLLESLGVLRPEDAETLRLYAAGRRPAIAAATFRKRVERALVRLRAVWRTHDERA
jgi:RNA polymerase sigma-70 factor (ECF subfamily)